MITAYLWLKWFHVLLAILAVGFNASYAVILKRARDERAHLVHALGTVHILDTRYANPAYVLLLLSGLAMTFTADLPLTTFWLAASLVIYVIVAVTGIAVYAPLLRKTRKALDETGPDDSGVDALLARGNAIGGFLLIAVAVIVFMMVMKPAALW